MADFTCDPSYLAPTGFKVSLDRKNYPNISFFAQQVTHPSMDINVAEQAYRRAAVVAPGDVITFGPLTMNVLMDENMNVYSELYDWLHRLVEEKTQSIRGDDVSSYCDIRLSVLTSNNNTSKSFVYVNALPTSLGDIAFASTEEGQYITFPISFRFDYFQLT